MDPDEPNILASYGADLAYDFSRRARALVAEMGPGMAGIRVAEDSAAVGRWGVAGRRGGLVAAGVGGPIIGRGAGRLFVIDDPVKNQEEAQSEVYRERAWQWWLHTARTRLDRPTTGVLLIMSRWDEDDLAGRLIAAGKRGEIEPWDELRLPALAEEGDPLGRKPGEALWPERFDVAALERIRREVGEYVWAALFQGRPLPAGGGLFKREWFRYFDFEPAPMAAAQQYQEQAGTYILRGPGGTNDRRWPSEFCYRFSTCDVASTMKTASDYFVLATWGVTPDRDLLLLDVLRTRLQGPEQEVLIASTLARWRPAYIGVEESAYGRDLLTRAIRAGFPMRALRPGTADKWTRALSFAARCEAGTVYHRAGADWLADWEREHCSFKRGAAHDDQVDCSAYAALELYAPAGPKPAKKSETAAWIDEVARRHERARQGEGWTL